MNKNKHKIAVIGLGYVGLPLAAEFAKKYYTVGFDINSKRVIEISKAQDSTMELSDIDLSSVLVSEEKKKGLFVTENINDLRKSNYYIITVPTPIDKNNKPDLTPLYNASQTIGKVLKKGDVVVYESTVYPGATEEDCVPILEKVSGLVFNQDFFVGYSPERINPGDKQHRLINILKITSGSTPETAQIVDNLYSSIITSKSL